ncbi:MAG TPA: DUF3089 domain-containing protein, partial [Chitinophagaceae bacterium]|nr:DUF3089 domain-containing protein [Chitinophagaceae bacterium]
VCAYIVGWQIKPTDFKTIPVGESPSATGCYVGWRSYKKGQTDFLVDIERGGSVCVNPISWTTNNQETTIAQHKGAVGKDFSKLVSNTITASISPEHHILWVDAPGRLSEQFGKLKNYHIADYNLFYMDIRENVLLRVKAFLNKK